MKNAQRMGCKNSRKTPENSRNLGVFWVKTPEKGQTLRKTPENSTAMEFRFRRLFYVRNFASPSNGKRVKRWTVGQSHFLVCEEEPSCETGGIPKKHS